jgi:hypothetical protein
VRRPLLAVVLAAAFTGCQPPQDPTPAKSPPEQKDDKVLREGPGNESNPSIVHLLAHPDRYHGKKIQVEGYILVRFEGTAIYLSREDAEYGITSNGFWVDFDPKAVPFKGNTGPKEFDKKYVHIEGTFDRDGRGHLGLWSGTIKRVSRIYELKRRE